MGENSMPRCRKKRAVVACRYPTMTKQKLPEQHLAVSRVHRLHVTPLQKKLQQ
jgi:hypothetical protein